MRKRANFPLVLFMGVTLVAGSMAAQQFPTTTADSAKPSCRSATDAGNVFKILGNQTYALCATASSFVFNGVAYAKCDIKFGDSIMFGFEFDNGQQDVCTVNEEGVKNGYMVSTFSLPTRVLEGGDLAVYNCPGGSDGAYAQCGGGICFKSTQKQSFPGFDKPLGKDEIICSCPITQKKVDPVGFQIIGPYPCQQTFFDYCKSTTANTNTGSTIYVGAPTGTANLLTRLLTGSAPPPENICNPTSN
jgi:hypothetical protein